MHPPPMPPHSMHQLPMVTQQPMTIQQQPPPMEWMVMQQLMMWQGMGRVMAPNAIHWQQPHFPMVLL
jgi:hypothetical protein